MLPGSISVGCCSHTFSERLRRQVLVGVLCCCCWSILLSLFQYHSVGYGCEAFGAKIRIRSRSASLATTATPIRSGLLLTFTRKSANKSNKSRMFLSDIPDEDTKGTSIKEENSNKADKKSASEKETSATTKNKDNKINSPNFWTQWWQNMNDSRNGEAFEDKFTLGGDLLAIAVYGWTDHFFGSDLAQYLIRHTDVTSPVAAMPAWMSPSMSMTTPEQIMMVRTSLSDELVAQYSPLLQTMGGAATSLAAAWLVAGWIWQSFRYHNTMGSSPDRVLVHTALTWFTATVLLLLATVLTNAAALALWTLHMDPAATTTTTAITATTMAPTLWPTQGDLIFAIDAWSLLTMWRFLICIMLGGGGMGRK